MKKHSMLFWLAVVLISCGTPGKKSPTQNTIEPLRQPATDRSVTQNMLTSNGLPEVAIKVDDEFNFIGNFDFEIIASPNEYEDSIQGKPIAKGERFVFAADSNKIVEKLFIVQFEGFLPEYDFTYNYNFDKADFIGNNKYRHNTWFYNNSELAQENPTNEGAKTTEFLKEKGFVLEDEFMMSRWVGLASEDRKNEIIIFYIEMLKNTTGHTLHEIENALSKEEADVIEQAFILRSKSSFSITRG